MKKVIEEVINETN